MSLSEDFPKPKGEIEREVGLGDRDASKPLLLRLLEQVKFGGGAPSTQTFGSNPLQGNALRQGSTNTGTLQSSDQKSASPDMSSPDPSTKKEN